MKKMKAYIVARQMPGKTDFALQALDAILYGPVHEFDTNKLTTDICDILIDEFERLYPDKMCWDIAIETDIKIKEIS